MKKYTFWQNMKYVYQESIKKCPSVRWYLILNFVTAILVPLSGTLITSIVVYALTKQVMLHQYILIILGIAIVTFILEALQYYSFNRYTWENTFVRCSTFWVRLSEHQISIDYSEVEPKEKQKINDQAFEALGSNWVGIELMLKSAPPLFVNIVGMLIYGVLIMYYTIWVLPIMIIMSVMNYYMTRRANRYLEKQKPALNEEWRQHNYLANTTTNINHGKDIRLYRLDKWFGELFVTLTKRRSILSRKVNERYLTAQLSNTIFLFIRDAISYYVVINMVINDHLEVATFTLLMGIITGFSMWLNGFMDHFNNMRRANIGVNDYRYSLTRENTFKHDSGLDVSSITLPIKIEFNNVSFIYPGADKPTIDNLSFVIEPGEKIAIVGNNGAGKTTIVKLLCGLYPPTSGEILINGHNLMDFNITEYMKCLSVVFQDSEPLAFTVLKNVTCVKDEDVDWPRFWKAVEDAGIKDKILSLEQKEQTYITQTFDESGVRLSGGETQKLMLARALYKGAPLLILDEPTAALDPISEEKMYLTYESFAKGHTSIFISHRLASTSFCNRIFYLENGQICECGSHQELMAKQGKYYEIFKIQSKYYQEDVA